MFKKTGKESIHKRSDTRNWQLVRQEKRLRHTITNIIVRYGSNLHAWHLGADFIKTEGFQVQGLPSTLGL